MNFSSSIFKSHLALSGSYTNKLCSLTHATSSDWPQHCDVNVLGLWRKRLLPCFITEAYNTTSTRFSRSTSQAKLSNERFMLCWSLCLWNIVKHCGARERSESLHCRLTFTWICWRCVGFVNFNVETIIKTEFCKFSKPKFDRGWLAVGDDTWSEFGNKRLSLCE